MLDAFVAWGFRLVVFGVLATAVAFIAGGPLLEASAGIHELLRSVGRL